MATKKKTFMPDTGYTKLKDDLAAGTLGTVYILYGEEQYLRAYYTEEMRKRIVPAGWEEFNDHRLEGKDLTVQTLMETVESLPMMGERTFVQVTDWDVYRLPEEQRTALIALLEDFPDYCCLVLVYDQLEYKPSKTYKKLYAALDKYAQAVNFQEQSQRELVKWVSKRVKAAGHTIDNPTAEYLLFTCGSLMAGLIPELEKISAYAKGPRITREDIDAVAVPVLEAQVFDMTGALSKGDYNRAASVLGTLFQLQEEPIPLLALMGKELRRLYTARIALDTGKDKKWLMDRWHMRSDYPARLLMDNARRINQAWCRDALCRCYQADVRMKSVSGVNGEDELKLLLAALAQGARA